MPVSPPQSPNSDVYSWIGARGADWTALGNWFDTSAQTVAPNAPSPENPVVLGNGVSISGGGTAASILTTGLVTLAGTIDTVGALAVGSQVAVNSTTVRQTAGTLSLLGSADLAAASVSIVDGGLTLGAGASLSSTGAFTAGSSGGLDVPYNGGFIYAAALPAAIGLAAGASLSAGSLVVTNGTIADSGGTIAVGGSLSIGPTSTYGTSQVIVTAGGTLTVAGDEIGGLIYVSGAGSSLRVAGTATGYAGGLYIINPSAYSYFNGNIAAAGGGIIQLGGVVLGSGVYSQFPSAGLSVDKDSIIEIGTAGGAATGALTVDAGRSLIVSGGGNLTGAMVDNGTVCVTIGTLSQRGAVSGSGVLQIGQNATLALLGDVAASDTIAFQGAGATLSIPVYYPTPGADSVIGKIGGLITGFVPGDVIIVADPLTGASFTQGFGGAASALTLSDAGGVVETLAFAGDFTGERFVLSATSSNASIELITPQAATGEGTSGTPDAYLWTGSSGGSWGSAGNWDDVTGSVDPAANVPGALTPVTIVGPAGSPTSILGSGQTGVYEAILGGGAAASVAVSGDVNLSGNYSIAGALTVGQRVVTTTTIENTISVDPGGIALSAGDVVSTGSVVLLGGQIDLAPGVTLSTSGAITIGQVAGNIPSSGTPVYQDGSAGVISVAGRAQLSVASDLNFVSGELNVTGGRTDVGGDLSVGTPTSSSAPFGSIGVVDISAGGSLTVAGGMIESGGTVSVDGVGSRVTVAGTFTTSGEIAASDGAVVQVGQLVQSGFGLSGSSIAVDAASALEIGTKGGAQAGAVTVDAGRSLVVLSDENASGLLVDNGLVVVSGGLLISGAVSGSGQIQIGTGGTLCSDGIVDPGVGVSFVGKNATLSFDYTYVSDGSRLQGVFSPIGAAVSGFDIGDSIDLFGSKFDSATYSAGVSGNPGTLVIANGGTTLETVLLAGDYTGKVFSITAGPNRGPAVTLANATVACFASGTRIAGRDGAIAVERLQVGDLVRTASGGLRPVAWIGHRRVDVLAHPDPCLMQPIRIRAGAVAPGIPCADLLLSPDHAVLIDGMLVGAHRLVNGRSIVVEPVAHVTYWHVELETHDILLAEGMAVESYLDTGNRDGFEGGVTLLQPGFAGPAEIYAARGVAPLVTDAAVVRGIWQRLAGGEGVVASTQKPGVGRLSVRAPGVSVSAALRPGRHLFPLRGAATVILESGASRPSDSAPWGGDRRRLGVAVSRVRADGVELAVEAGRGWHAMEQQGGRRWRWTDGAGEIVVPAGARVLEVTVEAVAA